MSNSKISKNALANIIGIVGQIIIAFFLSPFLVSTLGDTKYGIWTIAVAFTGYMNLMDFGMTSAVNKFVSKYNGLKDKQSINSIVATALVLFCIMSLIIVMVSPWMADFIVNVVNLDTSLHTVVHLLIIIVSFDIGIVVISGLYKGIFSGFQQYSVINYTLIISAIYKALMFYYYLSNGYELLAMGYISISANLLMVLIFYIKLKRLHPFLKLNIKRYNKSSASQILNYSKFTFLAMVANQIIYYSDAFVIGYFLSAAAVTYYSIPWTLTEYTKKISKAISQTYVPAISESEATGNFDKVKDLYVSGTKYMIIVSNLLSIGVIVLGGAFIAIWMGPKYKELCETVLIILFINLYVQGPQQLSYSILQGLAKQKLYSLLSMAVSIINLLLSIALIQEYGIVGVALGAAIPQVLFHGILVPWMTLKTLGLSAWYYFKNTYLLSIVPTVLLFVSLFYIQDYNFPGTYLELLLSALLASMVYMISLYFIMLSKFERGVLVKVVRAKLKMS